MISELRVEHYQNYTAWALVLRAPTLAENEQRLGQQPIDDATFWCSRMDCMQLSSQSCTETDDITMVQQLCTLRPEVANLWLVD